MKKQRDGVSEMSTHEASDFPWIFPKLLNGVYHLHPSHPSCEDMFFIEGLSSKKIFDTGGSQLHITRYILPFWDARGDAAHMKMRMTKAPGEKPDEENPKETG